MPLIYSERHPDFGELYLWNTQEETDFFETNQYIDQELQLKINSWKPQRKKEWLAARFLLMKYFQIPVHATSTDELGKVHLTSRSDHVSISHTAQIVGVQMNRLPVGLDLQVKSDKIHKVAKKFCSENDYSVFAEYYSTEDSEQFLWSLKESVFKAYGKGRVQYKEEVIVEYFENKNLVHLKLARENEKDHLYLGRLRMIGDFCLTQVIEKE